MKGPTNSSARPNIRLLNVSATFESNPDTETNTAFPYRATIDADGVTNLMLPTVMFSQAQAISGNFATYCQTDTDKIYVYSKTDVGTITIPAISCDLSVNYINVDNVPTEDSQAVITSGGVYDALENKLTKDVNLTDGAVLKWDATNQKAVDEGTVGSDTKPLKSVNGVLTPVSNDLVKFEQDITSSTALTGLASGTYSVSKKNGMCTISFNPDAVVTAGSDSIIATVPRSALPLVTATITTTNGTPIGRCFIYRTYSPTKLYATVSTGGGNLSMTLTYPIEE